MANKQGQARRKADGERGKPAQPAWRRPPARSRKQMQRTRGGRKRLASQASGPAAAASTKTLPQVAAGSRRKLRIPWRSLLRYSFLLAVTGALAYGMVELIRLPELAVAATSTQIGGAARTSKQDIFKASGVEGRNIFLIRAGEVISRVREVPGVESAEVHLRLPNQVIIDVREYAPLVAWQGITTTVWLAENASEVPQEGGLPPLTLVDQTGMTLAESERRRAEVLMRIAELHETLPDVRELAYAEEQGLYYRSPEGWEVWLGDGSRMKQKLALLDGASQKIAGAGVTPKVIDLRFGGEHALLR